MADRPANANANITEIDGPYYPVRLEWVPRVGELIDLYPFTEVEAGHRPSRLRYEVVQVVHHMHDVTHKQPDGSHSVEIFVRQAHSTAFFPH